MSIKVTPPPPTHRPHHLNHGDMLWLRWGILSVSVLFCIAALVASGCMGSINQWHTAMLQGAPFYLSEAGAQAGSLLSPAMGFACCIPLTLYWAAVLMHQKNLWHRTQLSALAMVALALPGMLSVLWDTVVHTSPLLCCILLTWMLTTCIPFFSKQGS